MQVFCMPLFDMQYQRTDLALRLAIREALVRLETVRPLASSPHYATRLDGIASDLHSLLTSLAPDPMARSSGAGRS